VAHDADVHGPGMQVDTAGKLVWVGVESPEILCRGQDAQWPLVLSFFKRL
jgi:hypothetical protein